jgi:hypothetical protein
MSTGLATPSPRDVTGQRAAPQNNSPEQTTSNPTEDLERSPVLTCTNDSPWSNRGCKRCVPSLIRLSRDLGIAARDKLEHPLPAPVSGLMPC